MAAPLLASSIAAARPLPQQLAHGIPWSVGILCGILWGIGQHLPYDQLYVAGIGPGDVMLLAYLAVSAAVFWHRAPWLDTLVAMRQFVHLVVLFVVLALISGVVTALRSSMNLLDLVETVRPLYYVTMAAVVAAWVREHGMPSFVIAFLIGVLVTAVANMLYEPETRLVVFGFPTLRNPNVVGNMLGVGTFLASLLLLWGRVATGVVLASSLLLMSVFTYSKGAWLMSLFGVAALAVAWRESAVTGRARRMGRWIAVATLAGLVALVSQYYEQIWLLLQFKLSTTQVGSSAAEGGTLAQRWGFLKASVGMAMEHPLTGVGLSNFENRYDSMREALGASYHPTDNPHSAFLYVLACNGVLAFTAYVAVFLHPFGVFARVLPRKRRLTLLFLGLMVFGLSGGVAIQLLSQPFFWVFTGVVCGWALQHAEAARVAALAHARNVTVGRGA